MLASTDLNGLLDVALIVSLDHLLVVTPVMPTGLSMCTFAGLTLGAYHLLASVYCNDEKYEPCKGTHN